jgi:asparagine synthase (glutamine-hydrolysing)
VKSHLVSDVPFGVFLSGGIDSTIVASEMRDLLNSPIKAFAIGFEEESLSELKFARAAADILGLELITRVIGDDGLNILPTIVAHHGEPFGDTSCIPTWLLSELAREHVPMVLSGDGADEAFAGYPSYTKWIANDVYLHAISLAWKGSPIRAAQALKAAIGRRINSTIRLNEWQKEIAITDIRLRRQLWRSEFKHFPDIRSECFDQASERARETSGLNYAQYLDYQTYLPGSILTKVDIASMAHGLEVRTPFIDLKMLELAAGLPLNQRYRRNESDGKHLPKRVLGRRFPEKFVHRPKQGFSIPQSRWLSPGASARNLLEKVVIDPTARINRFFSNEVIRQQVQKHDAGDGNTASLWLCLFLGLWLEQNEEVSFR